MSHSSIITRSLAASVHRHANIEYYAAMLKALEATLHSEGYTLLEQASSPAELPPSVRNNLATAVIRARIAFLTPTLQNEDVDFDLSHSIESGAGAAWVNALLAGLAAEGIVPALEPDALPQTGNSTALQSTAG